VLFRSTYTFPEPPAEQDSDGDGVPDFVELANELNPNGGNDSDGDGGGSADSGSGSPAAEPTMPDTGASVRTVVTVSVSAALIFGFAFFVYASRRKLRFAWTNDRIASLMDDLDSRLTGLEQRARAAAARRKLRK
jgi:hypothetical protein